MTKIKFILEGVNQTFNHKKRKKLYWCWRYFKYSSKKGNSKKWSWIYIYLNIEYNAWELVKDNEKLQLDKEEVLQLLIETKGKNVLLEKMYIIDKRIDEIINNEIEKNNKIKEESSISNIPYIKSSSTLSI